MGNGDRIARQARGPYWDTVTEQQLARRDPARRVPVRVICAVAVAVLAVYAALFSWDQRLRVTPMPGYDEPDIGHHYSAWQVVPFAVFLLCLALAGGWFGRRISVAATSAVTATVCATTQGAVDIARNHDYGGNLALAFPPFFLAGLLVVLFGVASVAQGLRASSASSRLRQGGHWR